MSPYSEEFNTAPDLAHEWIDRLRCRDQAAWEAALQMCGEDLRQDICLSLNKRGLPSDLMNDIEQETWLIALEKISTFQYSGIEQFQHWLRVIALNRVRMFKRRRRGIWVSYDELEDGDSKTGGRLDFVIFKNELSSTDPAQEFDRQERIAALEAALRELKPRDAEILLRRIIFEETPRDLALEYGLAPRSVSMVLLRAKEVLQHFLDDYLTTSTASVSEADEL
jgi:RNA polymerase sigma factor (sigma-70 family)